jgi:hypothetical protein
MSTWAIMLCTYTSIKLQKMLDNNTPKVAITSLLAQKKQTRMNVVTAL